MSIRKVALLITLLLIILSTATPAIAADLPIDIDIIGQDTGTGEVHTANANVEILTPTAQEITQAINEHHQQKREEMISSLFVAGYDREALSLHDQMKKVVADSTLFNQPSDFTGVRTISEDSPTPTWAIIILFTVSVLGGFVLARVLMKHRKEDE